MEVKRLHSGFCTALGEVGTDFQMHGVGFLVTFLPTKKVTAATAAAILATQKSNKCWPKRS
jgi:hypothetical protein